MEVIEAIYENGILKPLKMHLNFWRIMFFSSVALTVWLRRFLT